MLGFLKKLFFKPQGYENHPDAVIVACYFNPGGSEYRKKAFDVWYQSIKHMNHRIVECVIGDTKPELPKSEWISVVHTKNLLWHKEALLNSVINKLPARFKYIFWLDTDIVFSNPRWMVQGVEELKRNRIIQPFEYCVHLNRDEKKPSFDMDQYRRYSDLPEKRHHRMWRSFCSNYTRGISGHTHYDVHGHVGLAWGARRSSLERIGLYDKALIGGADHIMAHAAAGQIPHQCITKSFTENIKEVEWWSKKFYDVMQGSIGFVHGDVYHIWHGDLEKREYLKRIIEFTPMSKEIRERDKNGLYVTNNSDHENYMRNYFSRREVIEEGWLAPTLPIVDPFQFENAINGGFYQDTQGGPVGDPITETNDEPSDFGGGETDGAGAGGSREDNSSESVGANFS